MKRFFYFIKFRLHLQKFDNKFKRFFLNNYLVGSGGRVPGLVFALNPYLDEIILGEALKSGVPTLSIADSSNVLTSLSFFFIGNNVSFLCL